MKFTYLFFLHSKFKVSVSVKVSHEKKAMCVDVFLLKAFFSFTSTRENYKMSCDVKDQVKVHMFKFAHMLSSFLTSIFANVNF